jgi:copper homeostasis protein
MFWTGGSFGIVTEPVLEVIAVSLSDAIEARKGGANRLEVVRDLEHGGFTPAVELVGAIKREVELPLRVMLRESVGYQTNSEAEIEGLCRAAEQFAQLDVDGVVIGFLKMQEIDVELTRRVLASAPGLKATFHHAFEDAYDKLKAVRDIKQLSQVDRILSHGGGGELQERGKRLAAYAEAAAPELIIIAGGGIDSDAISLLKRTTLIREFHVGRAARLGSCVDGPVDAELVRRLVQMVRSAQQQDK